MGEEDERDGATSTCFSRDSHDVAHDDDEERSHDVALTFVRYSKTPKSMDDLSSMLKVQETPYAYRKVLCKAKKLVENHVKLPRPGPPGKIHIVASLFSASTKMLTIDAPASFSQVP